MCGIAGIVDIADRPIDVGLLVAMSQAIAHRGPDDEGFVAIDGTTSQHHVYAGASSTAAIRNRLPELRSGDFLPRATIGLAHRRFSIIDLSPNGHQPFFDRDRSCCLVFNGELYNYLELRDQLLAHGVAFSTQSDTEVFLNAYLHWGPDCFSKFNGFWAAALYDFRRKQLLLTRDRIGKKPLYWTALGTRVFFASEIKALLQVPEIQRQRSVNEEAVYHWLVEGRKDLSFNTCFKNIYSLPSASWTVVDRGFPNNIRTFWSVPRDRMPEKDISTLEASRTLKDLLLDAVRVRLRSDVPLSVELSGGLDSSTLVSLAAELHGRQITTYTVRFPDQGCNEEPYARSVALRYNTDHRVLDSPTTNFWSQVLQFTYLEEEPYHSPNLQTNQVIWTQMRSMGTKVSLNGAGGDEDFAGYSWYYLPAQIQNLKAKRFGTYFDNALNYSQGRTNILGLILPIAAIAKDLCRGSSLAAWGGADRKTGYYKGKSYPSSLDRHGELSDVLYSDMTNTLMPYWLRSGDRGYMGIPLEVRAPFLDYRVVDFAFRLPAGYLFRHGWHKWILRKAIEDRLPEDVVWRRHKLGFPFPFKRFYRNNDPILHLILNHACNPYLDLSKRNQFIHDWKILSFILWYELFFNRNTELFKKIEALACSQEPMEDYGYAPHFLRSEGWAG
jgi:asparagine synthase (glutamine-hydrolysing)